MSTEEIVDAYRDGRMGRRDFVRKMAAVGVTVGAALAYADLLAPGLAAARETQKKGKDNKDNGKDNQGNGKTTSSSRSGSEDDFTQRTSSRGEPEDSGDEEDSDFSQGD